MSADLDQLLDALADPTRRRVVDLLREGPRRAGDLARALETSAPTMSKHLRLLRARGLIEEQRLEEDARVRLFQLRRGPFEDLQAWLGEVEGFWTEQLASFKQEAERRPRRSPDSKGGGR